LSLAPAEGCPRFRVGHRALALAAALLIAVGTTLPAPAVTLFGKKFFEANDETVVVPDPQPYTLELTIAGEDKDLSRSVRNASSLMRDEKKPPPGTAGLIARARGDYGRILAALYANAYYGGTIAISINGVSAETLRPDIDLPDPVSVNITVDPGPLFHFGEIRVLGLPNDPLTDEDEDALDLDDWEFKEGAVARSGVVVETESRLVELWRQRGHPKAAIVTRDIVADHRNDTVDVTLEVAPGPVAQFAEPLVEGTERVDPGYARFMTGIRPGEPYDPDTIERARKRMQDLGIFASVSIVEGDTVGPDGLLPITFVLAERKRHLIGGGVSYSTIDGAALEGYWMHRNLFGRGESLRFDASVSRIGAEDVENFSYRLATTFRRPGIFTPDTDMTLQLLGERETVDTYESSTIAGRAGIEHRFSPVLTGASAVNLEWADIDDAFGNHRYLIVSLPSELDYDTRDNKLDPTEGLRGTIDAEPLAEFNAGTLALVTKGQLSGYWAFDDSRRFVLAGRGALGTIVGADTEDIPATRRFYLGGGGSLRGFEYRTVGPEVNGDVVGGLSFFETSLELRIRVTDTIGIVPFIDAGAAYENPLPNFSEKISIGAGIGLRYFTPLGPLRFDVAVPLTGDHDNAFAFYVGLGQAF
jgi:translocation and assembly module TamA